MVFLVRECFDRTRINHTTTLANKVTNSKFCWKCLPRPGRSAYKNVMSFDNCFDCMFLEIAERKDEFREMSFETRFLFGWENRRTDDWHIREWRSDFIILFVKNITVIDYTAFVLCCCIILLYGKWTNNRIILICITTHNSLLDD